MFCTRSRTVWFMGMGKVLHHVDILIDDFAVEVVGSRMGFTMDDGLEV